MPAMDWKSSLLEAATYQQESAILEVALRSGAVYHYFGVPVQTYRELLRAESKGSYFNSRVRNRFAYAKILSANTSDGSPLLSRPAV